MSDSDPRSLREELEIRVVALLTGEMNEADADELEQILTVDEELSAYRDRMAALIGDVHTAREEIAPAHPVMRLSEERRQEIFGQPSDTESSVVVPDWNRRISWEHRLMGAAAIVISIFLIVSLISLPSLNQTEFAMERASVEHSEVPMPVPPPSGESTVHLLIREEPAPKALKALRRPQLELPDDFEQRSTERLREVASTLPHALVKPPSESLLKGSVGAVSGISTESKLDSKKESVGRLSEKDDGEDEGIFVLETFGVDADEDEGYFPENSLSGTRVNSRLDDAPISISAVNERLIEDLNISEISDLSTRKPSAKEKETELEQAYATYSYEDGSFSQDQAKYALEFDFDEVTAQINDNEEYEADKRARGIAVPQIEQSVSVAARKSNVRQTPKAEKQTEESPVSTFSLNVSDVSFKTAQAALALSQLPDPSTIRTEEFVNSFNYGDPAPREGEPVTLNWEIAKHPYAHDRHIVRFSLQTQAAGRSSDQPLNINLLLDNSGSMQRADRRAILEKSLQSLGEKLTPEDQLNIILFARQPRLIANANTQLEQQAAIEDALDYRPEGGTNLEAGLEAAYENARAHYNPKASNRVILMTDGAANLGDIDGAALAEKVIEQRKQGIALDAYGIGWEDYNDALLEEITRNGDGRYAFLNSVDTAAEDFSEKLAGTLRVAAADVKVQVIWNPERVSRYRQMGYDLHQLKKEDFRDNTVDAAEIGQAESGTALYVLKINEDPDLVGSLGTLHVRYREPATGKYHERSWPLEMPRSIPALEGANPSLKLAAASVFFAERLAENPYAVDYSLDELYGLAAGLPESFPTQSRVVELQNMINNARNLLGNSN